MDYKNKFKEFLKKYINENSPYKVRDLVTIKSYNNSRPYEIVEINVKNDGEIYYILASPRTDAMLPIDFKINELQLYIE